MWVVKVFGTIIAAQDLSITGQFSRGKKSISVHPNIHSFFHEKEVSE